MRQLLKPNAEQLYPFKELPILKDKPALHCVFGFFFLLLPMNIQISGQNQTLGHR